MNIIARLGLAGVAVAAMSAWNSHSASQAHQAAVDRFQLKPEAVAVMDACTTSMKRHKRAFKKGAARVSGCACMAKHIAEEFEPDEYQGANVMVDLMMAISAAGKGSAAQSNFASIGSGLESAIFKEWTDSRKMTLMRIVGEAVSTCSKPSMGA